MIKFKTKAILILIFLMIISVITGLSAMTGIAFADSNSGDFKNGHGTSESPYEISSVEEFNNVRYHLDAHFKQTENLDFSDREFAPIGSVTFPFTGHYDGGKYQISNINIKQDSNNVGLFSYIDNGAVVENLKVINAEIEGEYNVGAIAGTNRGTVIGCVSTSDVSGYGSVGGVVGLNAVGGEVKECGNLGNVFSTKAGLYVGGLVGVNNSLIQDCYNHGNINSDKNTAVTYSGGIVGLNDGESYNAEIERCYNIGDVTGKARGQVAGDNLSGKISDCKWLASELDKASSFDSGNISNVVVLDQSEFESVSSFDGWDFNNTWIYIKNTSEYPLLNREYVQVESVSFGQNKIEIQPGNSVEIKAFVKPMHATENLPNLTLNSNISGVTLTDNVLSISKSVKPGTVITLTAKAESKTANLTVHVIKIPVDGVKIINLDDKNEISRLHGLHFKGEVYPSDASEKDVEYKVDSSFAEITADGFLIMKENTPIGISIKVSAVSVDNPMKSDSIIVKVVKEPVTSVYFNSDDNFKVTGSLKLSVNVQPEQATYKDVTYKIVASTATGANLTNNVLTARGLGTITVIAEADGVKSEEFTVQVVKEPVIGIVWNIPENLTCGDMLVLNATAVPDNATFSEIHYSIVGDNKARATIVDGVLYAETAGTITIQAVADEYFSRKEITVDKIPVNEIGLDFAVSFKHTESLTLAISVSPENATYKNVIIYDILSDSADSRIESGVLYAKQPGSVTVRVTVDGISAERTVSVLKEAVQGISLNATYKENDFGEVYQFDTTIYPSNATCQDITYVLKSGDADLTETGLLLINPSVPVGSLIEVYAVVDGVESSVYQIKSGRISVKSVSLISDSETVKVGEGVSLVSSTVPSVVSNPGVTYVVEGNAEVIDDVLYVFDSEAVGTTIHVKVVVDGVESNAVSVNVVETPVENLTLTCASSFKVTENLKLTASVYPQNATDKTVTFTVISGQDLGAEIIDGYLYAEKVGAVKVKATAGNVSRELVICVQKEPVTRVVLTSSLSVKVNNYLKLVATAYPFNATYAGVSYQLIDNDINAEIIDGNIFFSSQVGKVTLRVTADGLDKDYVIEVTKEPVTGIVFAKTEFKHTESLELVTRVLPANATYNAVSYSILNDYAGYVDVGAYIENGKLYANKPGLVKLLVVTDDGDYKVIIDIEVTKEPVVGITMADYGTLYLDYAYRMGQIDLGTVVYPSDATYKNVEYSFETDNCSYTLDGKILTVKIDKLRMSGDFAAEEQASITVQAVADGVEFYQTYVFHKFDLSDENEIIFNSNSKAFKTSGKLDFTISLPDKITYKDIEVTIGGDATKIGAQLSNDGEAYSVVANYPGTILVHVTSLCSGMSNNFEIRVVREDVHKAVLGLQVKSDPNLDEKIYKEGEQPIELTGRYTENDTQGWKSYEGIEVQQGSQIMFRGFGYAEDKALPVTYGAASDFTLRFYKDDKDITDLSILNDYLSVTGNTITINNNAPVTSEIYVCTVANNGLESKRTKLIIQSAYINEIKSLHITEDGVITGLEYIPTSNIERVFVSIRHSSTGIVLTKEIKTCIPTVILQLYNKTMGGYFDVEYEVFFKQTLSDNSIHSYSYKRIFKNDGSSDNSFKGIAGAYTKRIYASDFNSIVWLDNYSNRLSNYTFNNEVKAVYIYNNTIYTVSTYLEFTGDTKNQVDLYLHNYGIGAPTDKDAILVNNGNSGLKLTVIGNSYITGGNGSVSKYGRAGINCSGALTLEGDTLNVYGGKGGTGSVGDKGSTGSEGGRNSDGYGTKGGTGGTGAVGENGYTGGSAIKCKSLVIDLITLNATGGQGGTGGRGGQGGTGGKGGSGRNGDFCVYSRKGGDGGTGGKGGTGGQGGTGGYAIEATSVIETLGSINLYGGAAGSAGAGGYAGNGGAGGKGGNHYINNGKEPDGNTGSSGTAGDSGSVGVKGNALNGISLSGSNVTIG